MHLESLILQYGYPVLFLGVLLEGEAFLILAAYLAHRGYFSLPIVIGVAALSSFTVAQAYFYVGQRYGGAFLARHPGWQARLVRVQDLLHRYGVWLVLGFRALYGLRGVIPAGIGLSNYSARNFLIFNALGAIVWAVVIALAGNGLAHTGERIFGSLRRHEPLVIGILLGVGVVWGLYRLYRQPNLKRPGV